jgi:hypothetical protein
MVYFLIEWSKSTFSRALTSYSSRKIFVCVRPGYGCETNQDRYTLEETTVLLNFFVLIFMIEITV